MTRTFTDNLLSFSSAPVTLPKVGFFMPKYVRVWSGHVEGHETPRPVDVGVSWLSRELSGNFSADHGYPD